MIDDKMILFIGLVTEGATDERFFKPIIKKVANELLLKESTKTIDIEVQYIASKTGTSFTDKVLDVAKRGYKDYGVNMLVVHTDADDVKSKKAYTDRINPAIRAVEQHNEQHNEPCCKICVPLVPIRETESWMLADKELFIRFIQTNMKETDLGIKGNAETFNNPKEKIKEAIRLGRANMPKKIKDKLKIEHLYAYLGASIPVQCLENYESYRDFKNNLRKALQNLGFL
jgi:hypothetical protein